MFICVHLRTEKPRVLRASTRENQQPRYSALLLCFIKCSQLFRRGFGLEYEGFWLFVGGDITLAAVWELGSIDVALGPIVLIAFGMTVLVWALRK